MVSFDPLHYPYQSRRNVVYARRGMVATSQPLAAQAGLEILKLGGNAIDAAIATAASLTVLEPTSNGIGGDAFALVWTKGQLHGLNSSGPAPQAISAEALKQAGYSSMPQYGFIPVNVPGIPAAWAALSERFGKLPLTEVLRPAIEYAKNGYPISPTLGHYWHNDYETIKNAVQGEEFAEWFKVFAPEGRAPKIGEMWHSPDHAKTLQSIAETKAESFYRGEIAELIDAESRKYNGFLRKKDLADFYPEWVEPIKVSYKGYDVWEIPPNGQGLVALLALNILKGFDLEQKDHVETVHKQIEAMKLAFEDGTKFITDTRDMPITVEELLSEEYATKRRASLMEEAQLPRIGEPVKGGTVYLATADQEGNMVSFIQSNYRGFGSCVVIPGTGIALHNRGMDFSLDPLKANFLKPGKKTYHTIIPGFLSKDNQAVGPFGVMGAYMQPQGHVQVLMNTINFHLNPQAALDSPRWRWVADKTIEVEPHFPDHLTQSLARKGHHMVKTIDAKDFGRGQIIWRNPETGVLMGATDFRTDGEVAAW